MDVDTKEIVGLDVGSCSRKAAKRLWLSLPAVIGQCAVSYTDFWQAYKQMPKLEAQSGGQGNRLWLLPNRASTVLCANVLLGWSERRSHFPRKSENHIGAMRQI